MEETFVKSALPAQDVLDLEDTSLALPDQPAQRSSTRNESGERSLRVHQQVQLTMSRKTKKSLSNGGANFQMQSAHSIDGIGGFTPHTKTNGLDFSTQSLSNGLPRKPSRRVEVSPPPSAKLPSNQFSYSAYRQGFESARGPRPVKTLSQRSRESNSFHGRTLSGALHGSHMHTSPRSAPWSFNHRSLKTPSRPEFVLGTPPLERNAEYEPSRRRKQSNVKREMQIFQGHDNASFKVNQPDRGLSWLAQVRKNGQRSMRQTSYTPSVNSVEMDSGRNAMAKFPTQQIQMENVPILHSGIRAPEMNLGNALNFLTTNDEEKLISAANYIQSECFQKDEARQKVLRQRGIEKLLRLLENDSEEVQRAAAGALRNVVYKCDDNKQEVKDKGGLELIVSTLAASQDKETRHQLTGVLWNLSSNDLLKEHFPKDTTRVLTKLVLVPSSGLSEGENPKDELLADAGAFYNATGYLRNLSSAGPDVRKNMRDCENLIDSLVYYIRGTIANRQTDDESTENCVCILNNLTYHAESEVLHSSTRLLAESRQNLATESSSVGCFPYRSAKITKELEREPPLLEEKANPHGSEWLWSPSTMRMYLSLVACSTRILTQEAAVGALQNISAGNNPMGKAIASIIVQREDGLQNIQRVLKNADSKVKIKAVFLIRNLSRYQKLQPHIVKKVLPDVVTMLLDDDGSSGHPSEVTVALLHILIYLSQNDAGNVNVITQLKVLPKIVTLSESANVSSQVRQASDILLYTMWRHNELHGVFKRRGYKKSDFINARTTKAVKTQQR